MRYLALIISMLLLAGCNLAAAPQAEHTPSPQAADLTCSQLVASALQAVGPACDNTGRNQACYGHTSVEAQFQQGIQATFSRAGDLAQLQGLRLLSTAPIDETEQVWGIALMQAQANLPDDLPGQNVTFLFYGGATLDNISPAMDSVVISTGLTNPTCASVPPSAVLIQSPDGTQATLNLNGATVTLGSTLYVKAIRNDVLTIATVNGLAIVEAFGTSRQVLPGGQVTLPLNDLRVMGAPSEVQPFDLTLISRAPFNLLNNPVQIPAPLAIPTAQQQANEPVNPGLPVTSTLPPVTIPIPPTALPTACTPRTDWPGSYVIQAGDTLFKIAQQYGLSLAELQSGNCIQDANIISAGQALRVPAQPTAQPQDTPTEQAPDPQVTATPTAANFRADESTIDSGACTTIRWDVDNIDSVFFEGEGTSGHSQQEVCPQETTRYTLLVIHPNGDQVPYFVTVEVRE